MDAATLTPYPHLSLVGQTAEGYPLLEVRQPPQVTGPLKPKRRDYRHDPLCNERGGLAKRSESAPALKLVEMVRDGERPAADLLWGSNPRAPEAAAAYAARLGLAVLACIERRTTEAWTPSYFVGRSEEDCLRLLSAMRHPLGSLAFDLAYGRALGYSELDVRHYLERRLRLYWPPEEHERLLREVYTLESGQSKAQRGAERPRGESPAVPGAHASILPV